MLQQPAGHDGLYDFSASAAPPLLSEALDASGYRTVSEFFGGGQSDAQEAFRH
jgi:hypothetical protein